MNIILYEESVLFLLQIWATSDILWLGDTETAAGVFHFYAKPGLHWSKLFFKV